MKNYTVYGIKNCDTVKKALAWLDQNHIVYSFHDYKSKGIDEATLERWITQVGWESLVNRKGMTWRQLADAQKEKVTSAKAAIELMKDKTSVIKRPIIVASDGTISVVGFDETTFKKL